MSKAKPVACIRLRGVRHNNLKNFDLDLPLKQLIVITGLSGSGKSSLAFDTLFAEGQRRYIETFSPYARQFFDRMDKPQVERIEGIPPAIAIEQRNSVKTTRSTVGTMTEICDHIKVLWPHIARLYCRQCGQMVRKDSPQQIWQTVTGRESSDEILVTFNLPLTEKITLDESLALIARQGYQRLLIENEIVRLEDVAARLSGSKPVWLTIVQDRLRLAAANRARFIEACEQAYHFGKGKLTIRWLNDHGSTTSSGPSASLQFSNRFHCATCDLEYREPSSALFSFNNPVGACPTCRGFGRTITIDYNLAIPDRSKTLAGGAIKPWQVGHGLESQSDMTTFCKKRKVPMDVPFDQLPPATQAWVIDGDPGYGQDAAHQWPRAWYGVKGYFRWLESKSYKMHVRVLLSRYRAYQTCPDCHGKRFQPDSLLFRVESPIALKPPFSTAGMARENDASEAKRLHPEITLADFYQFPVRDALQFVEGLAAKLKPKATEPHSLVLNEIRSRLGYLVEVGLGYLTLDRPTRSLSGGETERVNLTTCLGTRLVNTLFVLDEPSVGLHPRDTARLIHILHRLRDTGNTVVVVEHEASVMRAADQIVDLGPGQGEAGGHVVFQGTPGEILKSSESLTGQYLSNRKQIEPPPSRPISSPAADSRLSETADGARLVLSHATHHNLRDVTVAIPLQRFVCVTGVSGSGKTTLVREVLLPLLNAKLDHSCAKPVSNEAGDDRHEEDQAASEVAPVATLHGWESLGRALLVDQSSLGKTPRSNPAVYIGAFEDLRELFALTELARQRGLKASAFSFNSREGQCERCRGAGFEKIEMQFLSDVFIRCPDCNGRRYRPHILEIKLDVPSRAGSAIADAPPVRRGRSTGRSTRMMAEKFRSLSIADVLESTVDEVIELLTSFADSRFAQRAAESLMLLQEVGLGYLRLGQPINTLSGGECQRLKLVSHLAEFTRASATDLKSTLFLFDEPTTGLHFDDVRVLLKVFQRLVDAGHSVLVIEHNLDVIRSADWLVDLGPEAGDGGGRITVQGTPEAVAACEESHTGNALRNYRKPD